MGKADEIVPKFVKSPLSKDLVVDGRKAWTNHSTLMMKMKNRKKCICHLMMENVWVLPSEDSNV